MAGGCGDWNLKTRIPDDARLQGRLKDLKVRGLCNKGTALAGPKERQDKEWASAPAMAHPARNASAASVLNPARTFFVTTKTAMGKRMLQSERNAGLMIEVLRGLVAEKAIELPRSDGEKQQTLDLRFCNRAWL
jgi:hypothetical protein